MYVKSVKVLHELVAKGHFLVMSQKYIRDSFGQIEGLRAKRAYIAFLADFHFLQDRADFW